MPTNTDNDQLEARVPRCCPFCEHDGAFDGLGTKEERFKRFNVAPDGQRSREEVVQQWDRVHCPECGEQFALCRETSVPIPEEA